MPLCVRYYVSALLHSFADVYLSKDSAAQLVFIMCSAVVVVVAL